MHLRNADQWITITDKGRMTSLDNPEVRALASRYGDPDVLLQEAWRPRIPGINYAGNYSDYAADPWSYIWGDIEKVMNGTYAYFYPQRAQTTKASAAGSAAPAAGR